MSEDIFIEYLLDKGFKEDIGYLFKQIGDNCIYCHFSVDYYKTIYKFNIKVINNRSFNGDNKEETYSDWEEFKSIIIIYLREFRLKNILNKNG